jgi:hypothetical protein
MSFSDADLDTILEATGEPVVIQLAGSQVRTIQGKFRKNFETLSPYESNVGILHPVVTCKTSDLVGVTNAHSFVISGTEYKFDGKPEEQPSGFTKVYLGVKV